MRMPFDGIELPLLGPAESGCAYITDTDAPCGADRRVGSPYCCAHHAVCYLPPGSWAYAKRIAEIDTAARFVGGRVGNDSPRGPPKRFMRALDYRQR